MFNRKNNAAARRYVFLFTLLIAIITGCSSGNGSQVITVVSFSDIHFTPFYDTTILTQLVEASAEDWEAIFQQSTATDPLSWGEETDYNLMKQTIQKACNEATEAPFVIFTGDILTHRFSTTFYALYGAKDETAMRAFTYKTLSFFAAQVREYCGTVPVAFALGNTDSYEGDYLSAPGSQFLADTSELFYSTLLMEKADPSTFSSTYTAGGYYATDLLGSNLTLISLNTVFFSPHAASGTEDAAATQISWLEDTLSSARTHGKRVWILMHIPPGVDIYGSVRSYMDESGHLSDASVMWKADFQQSFSEILTEYSDTVVAILAGHTHMDEYRLSVENSSYSSGSVIVTPGISPIFGNNPAFKVISVSADSWVPVDYYSLYNPLDAETQTFSTYYTFSNAYGLSGTLDSAFAQLADEFDTEQTQRATYTTYYYSGNDDSNPINDVNWPAYKCGITQMDKDDFIECVNSD